MRILKSGWSFMNFQRGFAAIDAAVREGADIADLRWRASRAQRAAMLQCALSISNGSDQLAKAVETGSWASMSQFCGIPVRADDSLRDDVIYLEVMTSTPVAKIEELPVPMHYVKEADAVPAV